MFLAVSLFALPGFVSAYTKAVVDFPVLGQGQMSDDIYLYSCGEDSSCKTKTQNQEYGHITNVHRWPVSLGGPGGPVPATWVFLTLTDNQAQYFEFWQESPLQPAYSKHSEYSGYSEVPSGWDSCILGITADGGLDPVATTCVGVVATPAQGANGVPSFSMGAAMFSQSPIHWDPPTPSKTNTLPSRGLTFINKTSVSTICLQTDSSFEHEECSGANKISKGGSPYVIDSSDLHEGANSGVGQVAAYQLTEGQQWVNTGMDSSSTVYATNLEWTVWPEQDQYTPGPTTIDISLVNGFNIGVTLSPDRDTVCSVADTEGGTPYFVMYKANVPMAIFPKSPGTSLDEACPAENQVPDGSGAKTGCYSSCAYANIHNEKIDETCCQGQYNSVSTCTLPPTLPWAQDIDENSTRVYSWAFEDWRGTFTCEPTAKFTFTITNPPL